MSESKTSVERSKRRRPQPTTGKPGSGKPAWETPKLEDVSEQVMAQPYIRFT